jgi:hypothetical protein
MRRDPLSDWTVYITNDNCPDYTWGFTEEQTRRAMADLVAAHLDLMTRTDGEAPENRDRYNAAVTQEVLCFLERYPERAEELAARVREGRLFVSPLLCNTLWGLHSIEGAIRSLCSARRLERAWGVRLDVAEHIELPSLPWGMATILAGCGVRWLSIPFLDYDCTFSELESPPIFRHEGPDGSAINVILDRWASFTAGYMQGAYLLNDPRMIAGECPEFSEMEADEAAPVNMGWVPFYAWLKDDYPLRVVLASGTHGDLNPGSGAQAAEFAEKIRAYNERSDPHPRLVNATLAQFCQAADEAAPALKTVRGDFGHSWELWPVSLAKQVADMRENERQFLAVEALLALAVARQPELYATLRPEYEQAQWCWAMLSDHAWNGTDDANRRHNAELRRGWNEEFARITAQLRETARTALGTMAPEGTVTIFNGLSAPRGDLVWVEAPEEFAGITHRGEQLAAQAITEGGRRMLYFVSPAVAGFGAETIELSRTAPPVTGEPRLRATATEVDGPYYRVMIDQATGGLSSVVHQPSGTELVVLVGRTLGETVYVRDGTEVQVRDVTSEVVACGPVLARLRVTGRIGDTACETFITGYADLDRIDFDFRLEKSPVAEEERLYHVFPVLPEGGTLRVETPAAVIAPRPQPEGDLLPGADPWRFAVQGFVDAARPGGGGVILAPHDAFTLRLELEPVSIQAIGNDQNYKEVSRDQGGARRFRFRYSLRAYANDYDQARAVAWSRAAASPLLVLPGALGLDAPPVTVDPARGIATCLKPAEEGAGEVMLRLWETAGRSGPLAIGVNGFTRAVRTDLLERELEPLVIESGALQLNLSAFGLTGLRLRR